MCIRDRVHGRGGTARLHADGETGRLQVWVRDQGAGIPEEMLHRATLERGYSTLPGSLGFGFWLMIQTADRVYLHTGEGGTGTTLVLEQDTRPGGSPDAVPSAPDLSPA